MAKVNGLDIVRIPINGKNTLRVMRNGKELWNWTGLPAGYTLLEYIQSTGLQFINTGLVVDKSTYNKYKFELDIEYTTESPSFWQVNGCSGAGVIYYFGLSNSRGIVYGNGTSDITKTDVVSLGRYKVIFDAKNKIYKFGDSIEYSGLSFNAPSGTSIFYLLGYNTGSSCQAHSAKVYSFKVYLDDILVRDYIPATRNDGVPGLYDKVNRLFYVSSGSSEFIAGPEAKYTLLSYIYSNGTQYVDTGVTPKQNTRVVLECGGCPKTGWMEIFGAGISVKNPERNYLVVSNISNGAQMQYGSEYYTSAITNNRDVIDANKNLLYINGVLVKTFSNISFTSPKTLRIFDANTDVEDYPKYEGKIYSCQIYDNGTLIRDYIPVLRSDGVAGLYDKVNKAFYGSASSTPFTGA